MSKNINIVLSGDKLSGLIFNNNEVKISKLNIIDNRK